MDSGTLVDTLIEDGRALARRLVEEGNDISAACWVKSSDDHRWTLYISMPLKDQDGPLAAYRRVVRALRSLGETSLSVSDIVVIGQHHPITSDVLSILHSHSENKPTRSFRPLFGGSLTEEVYVYPSPKYLTHTDLTEGQKQALVEIYNSSPLAVDDLPYTDELERIHQDFTRRTGSAVTIRDVFKALKNLGRKGRLGGKVRPKTVPDDGASVVATENVSEAPGSD